MRMNSSVYDFPETLLSSLSVKGDQHATATINTEIPPTKEAPTPATGDDEISHATSCALCGIASKTVADQRAHYKSDFHRFNLKLKVRGQPAVQESQFEQIVEGSRRNIQDLPYLW